MSMDSEEQWHGFFGLDGLILDGVEEKLRSILEAERDEVDGRRAYELIGHGRVGQYRNGFHKPGILKCGWRRLTVVVP